MRKRPPKSDWLIIALIGLLLQSMWLLILEQPSYMDAYYYAVNGERLATGHGFSEMIIWQYLDNPSGLPTPSHTYWMPLPSILAAIGFMIRDDFLGQQLVFWLLGGLLPLLAFEISLQLSGQRWQAWVAALFTATGSFYGAFFSQPSTFAPFAWAGGLCLLMLGLIGASRVDNGATSGLVKLAQKKQWMFWILAGVFAGFGHLTRADGVLLLLVAGAVWLVELLVRRRSSSGSEEHPKPSAVLYKEFAQYFIFLIGGYLLVMGAWFIRNVTVFNRPLSTVGTQSMFLRTYDDLFAYGRTLDLATYLEWGFGNILLSKLESLWVAIQTLVAVPGIILLVPFIIVTLIKFYPRPEKRALLRPVVWYVIALILTMSIIFTFPGMRGAVFHSSSAIWPWSTAVAAAGIGFAVDWTASRLPHWQPEKAKKRFSILFIALALILGVYVSLSRVESDQEPELLQQIADILPANAIVMAGNAPAVHYHTGLPALSVPNETPDVVIQAAKRYGVTHLMLDEDAPMPLRKLYEGETQDPRFELLRSFEDIKVYQIVGRSE